MENYPLIAIGNGKEVRFFYPGQILYCISEGSYTKIKIDGGQTLMASKNLKEIEGLLPEDIFVRIHHGHIINLMYATKLVENGEDNVVMSDGTSLPVSRRKKSNFMSRFHRL